MKFALILCCCLVLTVACGLVFGSAMASTYPEGIYVYTPPEGREPVASDAYFIGMAMGTFFCTLIFATMTACAFLLNRMRSMPLKDMTAPLGIACLMSGAVCGTALMLAG